MIRPSVLLRRAILADAIFSGASALLLSFGAAALAPRLDLPEALLRETGLFLIAYAALVGWLGARQAMPRALVAIVIAGNAAWTVASMALLFSGWVTPNIPGEIFVAAQALAVGALAELQYVGLRRSDAARPAQA
jgi:CHASE2 domain-containing sensor protein